MNVGSLFSGVGGLDYGLARAGFRHAWFCESDRWRRSVLARHWPDVPIYEDARACDGDAVDLLAGGFPCQDVSVAGTRLGIDGDRSRLFFDFARMADAIRPGWLLVENVPGLLATNSGRDFGVVLAELAERGYGMAWRILDSRHFGMPLRRRRLFVVGRRAGRDHRAAAERAAQVLAVGHRCRQHPGTATGTRAPDRTVSLSGLGSGGADDNDAQAGRIVSQDGRVRRLTPVELERLQGLPDGWTEPGGDYQRYAALGDAVTVPVAEWLGRKLIYG